MAMKSNRWFLTCASAVLIVVGFSSRTHSQTPPLNGVWVYTLVNGSQLTEDCPICDRITLPVPMRGTFQLRFLGEGPFFANYAVENISFTAGLPGGQSYKVTGHGTYRIGGEIAVQQDLSLEATIDNGSTNTLCEFTNATPITSRHWPMFKAEVDQTNGTLVQQYRLEISAAPFREIWFSTVTNFQAGIWSAPTNAISGGDLLSSSGRVIKRNAELTGRLGIQPPVPDLGLKDMDVLPDGEMAFSIEQSVFSETIGLLSFQDLLSDRGRVIRYGNPGLIGNFQPGPPLPEFVGLEAVQMMDDGQVFFSVRNEFGSKKLGITLRPGDLLSDEGTVVRTAEQLLSQFNPINPTNDSGLKSVFVWPTREIWFSTRDGFYDSNGVFFASGDLLSDQGYVVYSNAELLSVFAPAGNSTNVGLDALFVVSDLTPESTAPSLSVPQLTNQPAASIALQRSKGGRVFQLEAATNLGGPFVPIMPITTDRVFIDTGALTNETQRFYRLHQW